MEIQWYPGHMVKTKKLIRENLKLVDVVLEVIDARIPFSSSNPDLRGLIGNKEKLVVLNKADLADPAVTRAWINYFKLMGTTAVDMDSARGRGVDELLKGIHHIGDKLAERWKKRGRLHKPVRIMVVGIPNVGKSSLINRISRKGSAKTGDKPGVTRGKQWIKVDRGIMLLDTPGVLWPKFVNEQSGYHLAFTGAIKDEVLDKIEIAIKLIDSLKEKRVELLAEKYEISELEEENYKILQQIGTSRGCLAAGGTVDTLRAASILLEDFRSGRLGRISLESPDSTLA